MGCSTDFDVGAAVWDYPHASVVAQGTNNAPAILGLLESGRGLPPATNSEVSSLLR